MHKDGKTRFRRGGWAQRGGMREAREGRESFTTESRNPTAKKRWGLNSSRTETNEKKKKGGTR